MEAPWSPYITDQLGLSSSTIMKGGHLEQQPRYPFRGGTRMAATAAMRPVTTDITIQDADFYGHTSAFIKQILLLSPTEMC